MSISQQKCDICHSLSNSNSCVLVQNNHKQEFNICLNCIGLLNEERKKIEIIEGIGENANISFESIKNSLNVNIFGQDEQKEQLAALISMHYDNIANNRLQFKNNILLIGPTGSGKTMIIKQIANILKVPMVQIDATTLTEAGYVGHDVDICIDELIKKTNGDIKSAQRGIVFIDELDKINKKESNGRSKDVGGVGVQQALLKMIEGSTVYVSSPQNPTSKIAVNTENILFIFAGAFENLYDIINSRINGTVFTFNNQHVKNNNPITEYSAVVKNVTSEDLFKYGMISELIGRIPHIIVLDQLSNEHMLLILKQILRYYSESLDNNVVFNMDDEVSLNIIESVRKDKTGARGLSRHIWNILANKFGYIYQNKQSKIYIDVKLLNNIPTITNIKVEQIDSIDTIPE